MEGNGFNLFGFLLSVFSFLEYYRVYRNGQEHVTKSLNVENQSHAIVLLLDIQTSMIINGFHNKWV
jgi:hypothetical protein